MLFEFYFYYYEDYATWRIYILTDIDYGSRDSSSAASHWITDPDSPIKFICWAGSIETFDQAKAVAKLWAETTDLYINSRMSFESAAQICREL